MKRAYCGSYDHISDAHTAQTCVQCHEPAPGPFNERPAEGVCVSINNGNATAPTTIQAQPLQAKGVHITPNRKSSIMLCYACVSVSLHSCSKALATA